MPQVERAVFTCEMNADHPDLTLPTDIDLAEINRVYNNDPVFVTLKVGEVDARSLNGRTYTRRSMEMLAEQLNARRVEGGWGHVKPEEFGTAYNPPAIRWLTARMEGGEVWAKGLALTDETRSYYKTVKATNARAGTSLTAWATMEGEAVIELDLISLDLADPARVGIPQMATTNIRLSKEQREMDTMTIEQLIQERDTLKARLAELEAQAVSGKTSGETLKQIGEALKLSADADAVKAVKALAEQHAAMAAEMPELLKLALESQIEKKVKVESARPLISDLVMAEKPTGAAGLATALESVLKRDALKPLLSDALVGAMGAATAAGSTAQTKGSAVEKFFIKPEAPKA